MAIGKNENKLIIDGIRVMCDQYGCELFSDNEGDHYIRCFGLSEKLDLGKIESFLVENTYSNIKNYTSEICERLIGDIKVSKISIDIVENGVKLKTIKSMPNGKFTEKEYVFTSNEEMFSLIDSELIINKA